MVLKMVEECLEKEIVLLVEFVNLTIIYWNLSYVDTFPLDVVGTSATYPSKFGVPPDSTSISQH